MTFIRREDLPVALGAGAITVSVLSGKLGLGGEFLSIRLFATIAAIVLLWPQLRRITIPALAWILLAFLAYMAVRSFFGAGPLTPAKQIDALYFAAQIVLVAAVARAGVAYLAGAVLAIAAAYLAVAFFGQLFPHIGIDSKEGLGWGPVGTAITFSRIEFLGFCMAVILIPVSPVAIGLASIFLFATFSSLMKAAMVGSFVALVVLFGLLAAGRQWRSLATVLMITVVAFVAFQQTFAAAAMNRIARGFPAAAEGVPSAVDATESADAANGRFALTGEYCILDDQGMVECKRAQFVDASQRLILLAEALRGFMREPVVGNGMGSYHVITIHPYTHQPDPYVYPHNLIVEVAFEGGLVGLMGLAAAFMVLAVAFIRSPAPFSVKSGVGTFIAFMLVAVMFGGDLYDSRLLWLAGIAMLARWPAPEVEGFLRRSLPSRGHANRVS